MRNIFLITYDVKSLFNIAIQKSFINENLEQNGWYIT